MKNIKRTLLICLTLALFPSLAFADAFTSNGTGGGDFNDNAAWTVADWPQDAEDTFTIQAGDTVTVDNTNAHELGDCTVNGTLVFDDSQDVSMTFGHADLTIANGGELQIGTSGDVFSSAQTCTLTWATTSDNSKGLVIADGGKLTIYGDPAYYGSDDETTLANDADNTDDDNSIVTSDDMSAKWNVDDEICIKRERDGDGSIDHDGIKKYVIKGIANTTITLKDEDGNDETFIDYTAGIGNTWTAPVINVTRNVILTKASADTVQGDGSTHYNTNRPQIVDNNADGNNNCVISNAQITGFYEIDSDYDFQFLNSVFRNGYFGFYQGSGHTISGNVYANYFGFYQGSGHTISGNVYGNDYGFYQGSGYTISGNVYANFNGIDQGSGYTISGNVYANYYGIRYGSGHTISGNVYANYYGIRYGSGHTISGNVYANYYGFYDSCGHTITGRIGYDSGDNSQPNTSKDFYGGGANICLFNVKLPAAGLTVHDNQDGQPTEIFCEHHNRTLDAHRIYWNMGTVTKTQCNDAGGGGDPSEDPDGGSGWCIKMHDIQTGCDDSPNNRVPAWKPYNYRIWATSAAGEKNYKFYVQVDDDDADGSLHDGGLKLTAEYLDGVSGGSTSTVTDDSGVADRADDSDWTQSLDVDVTPAEDGWIDFFIERLEYSDSDPVYIWPEVEIS